MRSTSSSAAAAVVAILWAIRQYRPEPRLPWLVFAVGNVLFVAGDIAFDISPNAAPPAVADYLYLIAYPLFAALPVMLLVSSGSHRRIGALVDAAIVTLAFVVFEWIFVIEPALHQGWPLGQRVVVGVPLSLDGHRPARCIRRLLRLAGMAHARVRAPRRRRGVPAPRRHRQHDQCVGLLRWKLDQLAVDGLLHLLDGRGAAPVHAEAVETHRGTRNTASGAGGSSPSPEPSSPSPSRV